MKIKKETVLRTAVLLLALVNEALAVWGKEKLPFGENELYQTLSLLLTGIASVAAWWKNNSFTMAARYGDYAMEEWKKEENEDEILY